MPHTSTGPSRTTAAATITVFERCAQGESCALPGRDARTAMACYGWMSRPRRILRSRSPRTVRHAARTLFPLPPRQGQRPQRVQAYFASSVVGSKTRPKMRPDEKFIRKQQEVRISGPCSLLGRFEIESFAEIHRFFLRIGRLAADLLLSDGAAFFRVGLSVATDAAALRSGVGLG